MTRTLTLALFGAAGLLLASASLPTPTLAQAPGDAARGATVVKQRCVACHAVVAGKNGIGPSLVGVVGRKAASSAGFKYSPKLAASGLTWDRATLDRYLAAPMKTVPGTSMMINVPGAADRADIIAYLASL